MPTFKSLVLDILFPRRCLGCNILLTDETGRYICRTCLREIKFQNTFACAFCASPVVKGITCPYCRRDHSLDRLLVVTSYESAMIKQIIKSMKYHFVGTLAEQLGGLMAKYLKKNRGNTEEPKNRNFDQRMSSKKMARGLDLANAVIVPVPLHPSRLRWRGFNHTEILAKTIGQECGLEVYTDALTRVRNRKPQADMPDRASRIQNAQNLFQISGDRKTRDFTDKIILLVDDISTTGSTLDDCARALKSAGTKEVIGFVFARGTPEARKNRKTRKD